jgi:chromosome segregation protein
MFIQQIEIDNFKSFVGKTVIPFRRGFTTVSGPNGSGKSNIIDSILFCLGLSSSRTMRAEKLPDLINNTSKRREASVTIIFNKTGQENLSPEGDSSDSQPGTALASLPNGTSNDTQQAQLLANSHDERLITVSRRIKDGPNGYTSTYYLNGRVATLTEIHDTLGAYHVSPGCYNVMMQGDVAGIVNMSAFERRKIIDEIAGVAEFDRKIEQAEKELQATGENIDRNQILLTEIESRLTELAGERDKALKYQSLRDEKASVEAKLLVAKLRQLEVGLEASRNLINESRQRKRQTQAELQQLQQEIDTTHAELIRLSQEVKRKGEDQQIALRTQILNLKNHIARKQDAIQLIDKQATQNSQQIEKMTRDIERFQETIETLDGELGLLHRQEKELGGLHKAEAEQYEKLNARMDALTGEGGEIANQRSEVRSRMESLQDKITGWERDRLHLEAEKTRLQFEIDRKAQASSDNATKTSSLQRRYDVIFQEANGLEERKATLEAELSKSQLDTSRMRVALNNAQEKLQQQLRELTQLETRKKAYEEMNFGRAVETILQADITGVHGTLAQLCEVDSQYGLALEISLGGRLQNIIVDDDSVAKQGIEMLQRMRAGRATFLPMTKIKASRGLPMAPNMAGVVDFAYNLVQFDGQYADIFAFALGDTLIVEDLETARKLLNRYRMVTLDGSLLEKSGAMTGGSTHSRGSGQLFNGAKVEQEIGVLKSKIAEQEADKRRYEKHLVTLETTLEKLKAEYAEVSPKHARLSAELESLGQQIEELNAESEKVNTSQEGNASDLARLMELDGRLQALAAQIAEAHGQVQVAQQELEAIESKLPAAQIEALREEMKEVRFQMEHFDTQLRNVLSDIKQKQMERQFKEAGIEDHKKQIEAKKVEIEQLKGQRVGHLEEIALTEKQIVELESQMTELSSELRRLQDERDQVQKQLLELEKSKSGKERLLTQCDEQILAYQARVRELEPQIAAAKEELATANISLKAFAEQVLAAEEELQKQITSLTRRMAALEPVNMLAIREFEQVSERRTELAEKLDTLSREREALTLKISGYEELKRITFMKAFDSVNHHFKLIFAELSDGYGQLILTNPEDPLNGGLTIEAQPRGKKTQRIEAMSGGEKSLTSLAFVFSLQRYMPAPFYALDEVDMNLDGINAEKLANMVKRESNSAQFIVVSLRKPMLEHSDRTVGVTQRKNGVSKVTGIQFRPDGELNLEDREADELAASA